MNASSEESIPGGGSGQPSKVNGGVGGEVMSMRVRLRRETISRLVASKKLLLCFLLDNEEDEVGSVARGLSPMLLAVDCLRITEDKSSNAELIIQTQG